MEYELIYLASPYSHQDPDIRASRFLMVCQATAELRKAGLHVYSPIAHDHPVCIHGHLPLESDYYEPFNRCMLERADGLWVLTLEDWRRSRGIAREIAHARDELGIEVLAVDPMTLRTSPIDE